MIHKIEIYLDQVMSYAGLPSAEADKARDELADHLLSRVADLEKQGASRDDAAFRAIYEHGRPIDVGYSLRPRRRWVDVRMRGTARGVVAVGPKAIGIFACGVISSGFVSCGIVSFGILSAGMLSFGLLLGLGAISVASISLGMNTVGLIAAGLNSAGLICAGINSIGIWVYHGQHALSYFSEKTVPPWLQEIGFLLRWSRFETAIGLAPFIVVFGLLVVAAIVFAVRENKRVRGGHHWVFQ